MIISIVPPDHQELDLRDNRLGSQDALGDRHATGDHEPMISEGMGGGHRCNIKCGYKMGIMCYILRVFS